MPFLTDVLVHAQGKPVSGVNIAPDIAGVVAGFNLAQENAKIISAQCTATGLAFAADQSLASKGVFIQQITSRNALGTLTGGATFFLSDNFGGCDFAVLRNPAGAFVGAHVYSSDACRQAIQAVPNGWTFICSYSSKEEARLDTNISLANQVPNYGSMMILCSIVGNLVEFVLIREKNRRVVKVTPALQHAF